MAVSLFDLTGVATGTTGTGSITLGSALPGHSLFADAGVSDGDEVRYLLKDGSNRELGTGTYTASGTVLSRDTVHASIISGVRGTTKLTLSGAAEVYLVASSGDFGGGGGGGLVPISKTTASADAAVDIELTGGYTKYRVVLEKISGSSNTALRALLSVDGGSTFEVTNYDIRISDGATTYGSGTNPYIYLMYANGTNTTARPINGWMNITLGDGTAYNFTEHSLVYQGTASATLLTTGGCILESSTTAATHIRFYMATGNTTGTFHLYGIADGA
jgi:hypothetical protein